MGEAGEIISVDGKLTTVKGLSNKTKRVTLSDSSLIPGDEIAIPNPTQDRYEVRRLYRRAMLEDIHSGYLVTSDGDEIIAPSLLRIRRMREDDLMVSLSELGTIVKEEPHWVYYHRQKRLESKSSTTDKWSKTVVWLEPA